MRAPIMALIAVAQVALVILGSGVAIALTGDPLITILVMVILTVILLNLFTRGPQAHRGSSCG